jgi:hypothetical protein
MERVRLDLDCAEYAALARLAQQRLRPLPLEARHIVRDALQQAGLLHAPNAERCASEAGVSRG